MKIQRPILTNRKTQSFGESKACVKVDEFLKRTVPVKVITKKKRTCPIGYMDLYESYDMKGHNGDDWNANSGEPLYFPVDADSRWWSKSEVDKEGGIGLDIYSTKRIYLDKLPPEAGKLAHKEWKDNDKKVYVKFRFWHLKGVAIDNAVRKPEDFHPTPNVKQGDLIGYCDSTGASSGSHLHWSMKIVAKNSMTLDANNGYYGAVDFSRWFHNEFTGVTPKLSYIQISLLKIVKGLEAIVASLQKQIDEKRLV